LLSRRLGISEDQPAAAPSLQSPANPEQASIQVQVIPPQAECLALSQSERQADEPSGLHPVAFGCLDQPLRFVGGERGDLMLSGPWRVDQRGWVHLSAPLENWTVAPLEK
jgi:hypothetical protein